MTLGALAIVLRIAGWLRLLSEPVGRTAALSVAADPDMLLLLLFLFLLYNHNSYKYSSNNGGYFACSGRSRKRGNNKNTLNGDQWQQKPICIQSPCIIWKYRINHN